MSQTARNWERSQPPEGMLQAAEYGRVSNQRPVDHADARSSCSVRAGRPDSGGGIATRSSPLCCCCQLVVWGFFEAGFRDHAGTATDPLVSGSRARAQLAPLHPGRRLRAQPHLGPRLVRAAHTACMSGCERPPRRQRESCSWDPCRQVIGLAALPGTRSAALAGGDQLAPA